MPFCFIIFCYNKQILHFNSLLALSNALIKKLKELIPKFGKEKENIKVVIDSGNIHQYSELKKLSESLEKDFNVKVSIREKIEKETINGFFEDLAIEVAKGNLKKDNIEEYSKKIAQATLFEAIYSAYRSQIHGPLGTIDREQQETVYKKYLPKVQEWGEQELKKFWQAIYKNPELKPYLNYKDIEKILKEAGLD